MGVVSKNGRNFQEKKWVGYSPTPYHNQPHKINPLTHFQLPNQYIPNPQKSPHKTPTTIEIPTFINPNPKQTQTQNTKTPQNPKIIKKSNKLIINNR